MEKNNWYNEKKEKAILALKSFEPTNNIDVRNIIETIRDCYEKTDVEIKNNNVKVTESKNLSSEVQFLIRELNSFIEGLNE